MIELHPCQGCGIPTIPEELDNRGLCIPCSGYEVRRAEEDEDATE